jgi:thiamine monophosphate kinase
VIKAEIKIINTSKIPKGALLFSSRLRTCSEMYKNGKIGYSSAPLNLLSNASRINILGDLRKKLQPNLWASHI